MKSFFSYVSIDYLKDLIDRSLTEDTGSGDYSSLSCIDENSTSKAFLKIKDQGIIAGIDLAEWIFSMYEPSSCFNKFLKDGDAVDNGQIAFEVYCNTQKLLQLERIVLNLMQRLSGIATQTYKFTELLKDTDTKLLDTRKTTPTLRLLEKWAVTVGGGHNHRFGLYDMIMLKDNHIDAAGGLKNAIEKANKFIRQNKLSVKIEVETRNLQEVEQVLEIGKINRIMFDNFSVEEVKKGVTLVNKKHETEVSGGITIDNILPYAQTGVDYISTSQITHSVKSLDLSLKIMD